MALSITPTLIIAAAKRRGWQARILDEANGLYRLDAPSGQHYYIRNSTSIGSHSINAIIATRKDIFYNLAKELDVLTPDTLVHDGDDAAAADFLAKHGRVVVKPADQAHGDGITVNITDAERLTNAIAFARQYSSRVLIQQHVEGDDYRVLVIGDQLAAAAIRKPAYVVGDGTHTIAELITQENATEQRSEGYYSELTNIDVVAAERYLGQAMHDVPAQGQEVRVVGTANIGKGGVALDVTDTVHPQLVQIAQTVTRHFRIGLCGVDFLVAADGTPYLIEINTRPSLGLHEFPFQGQSRNTPDAYLDWLNAN